MAWAPVIGRDWLQCFGGAREFPALLCAGSAAVGQGWGEQECGVSCGGPSAGQGGEMTLSGFRASPS